MLELNNNNKNEPNSDVLSLGYHPDFLLTFISKYGCKR